MSGMNRNFKLVCLWQISVVMLMGLLPASASHALPVFAGGTLNMANFSTVQNWMDADGNHVLSANDIFYGITSVNSITAGGHTVWNANNVPGPGVDSFTGYYLAKVRSVTQSSPFAPLVVSLGASDIDPNGVFSAADLAAQTFAKLYADSATPFEVNGSVVDDIAKATDGTFWGSLGLSGGYWDAVVFRGGVVFGSGGVNFINNATAWNFISDPDCASCQPVQLSFHSVVKDFGANRPWQYVGTNSAAVMPVPEPPMYALFGAGVIMLLLGRKNRSFIK